MGILKRAVHEIVKKVKDKEQQQQNSEQYNEEFTWISTDDEGENHPKKKRKEVSIKDMRMAQLESEEIICDAFSASIENIIQNTSVKYEKCEKLDKSLWLIKEILESSKEQPEIDLAQAQRHLQGKDIVIPFPKPLPKGDFKFKYLKPSDYYLVGSYLCKSVHLNRSNGVNADFAIEMDPSLFEEKDFQNYKYFHKRAFYLAMLASILKEHPNFNNFFKLEFSLFNNDSRKPILIISSLPSNSDYDFSSTKFSIRIFLALNRSAFKLGRLSPSRNSVRPSWFLDSIPPASSPSELPPTPKYNNCILEDAFMQDHLNFIYKWIKISDQRYDQSFRKASILLKIWLRYHLLDDGSSTGGMNGFVLCMFMAWLCESNRINCGFGPAQMFKITLETLGSLKDSQPVFLTKDGNPVEPSDSFSLSDFTQNFDVVFVGPCGKVNLLSGTDKPRWKEIRKLASETCKLTKDDLLEFFKDGRSKAGLEVMDKYDYFCFIKKSPSYVNELYIKSLVNYGSNRVFSMRLASKVLQIGLSSRVTSVSVIPNVVNSFPLNEELVEDDLGFLVALNLNESEAFRTIDIGPSAEDENAASEFRNVWGSKAELRRFRDGSIRETVNWNIADNCDVHESFKILDSICLYLLEKHLKISRNDLKFCGAQCLKFISGNSIQHRLNLKSINKSFSPVIKEFETFCKSMRNLTDLPLFIANIYPNCPELRYSSVSIPQENEIFSTRIKSEKCPPFKPSLNVVIEFESSTRWPSDINDVQIMKRALLCDLAKKYLKSYPGSSCVVKVPQSESLLNASMEFAGNLEIITPAKFAFNCEIKYSFERILLVRLSANPAMNGELKEIFLSSCNYFDKNLTFLPIFTQKIQALVRKSPTLSQVIRLAKRWLSCQFQLTNHFSEELVEILCVYAYRRNGVKSSAFSGFVSFLDLIANHQWKDEPLLVQLDDENDSFIKKEEAEMSFMVQRRRDPNGLNASMFVVPTFSFQSMEPTESEAMKTFMLGSKFSYENPQRIVVQMAQTMCSKALDFIKSWATSFDVFEGERSFQKLFSFNDSAFDFMIHIKPDLCSRHFESVQPTSINLEMEEVYKNLSSVQVGHFKPVGFDPLSGYADQLTKAFGKFALFFLDQCGGTRIGVILNPNFSKRPVKITTGSAIPVKVTDGKHGMFDKSSFIIQLKSIGKGFVDRIESRVQ